MFSARLDRLRPLLGRQLTVVVDRPLGSFHPDWGYRYLVNYGYVPGLMAADGEEQDAYVLGVNVPLRRYVGRCAAIVHRLDDEEDKLVIVPAGAAIDEATVRAQTAFQEAGLRVAVLLESHQDPATEEQNENDPSDSV